LTRRAITWLTVRFDHSVVALRMMRGSRSVARRRILMVSLGFPPARGGIERTAGELAGGLNDDCEVMVVAGRPPKDGRAGMTVPEGVKVCWAPNEPQYGRKATAALAYTVLRCGLVFRPDVVVVMHIRAMPGARALRRLVGSRAVLIIHAKEVSEQPALARASVRWADTVVAVSDYARQLAVGCGADPERVQIIHPGVTLPSKAPTVAADRPGPPTIVTVSRMDDRHKGHSVALQSMLEIRAQLPDTHWYMVGDGALRHELEREVERLGLTDSVTFTGAVADAEVHRYLSSAHVFCLLTQRAPHGAAGEGFGIVFVEAGAHALPVVAGDVPGVRDAVLGGQTGILVAERNPESAAIAIVQLLTDREMSRRLGYGGVTRAKELSWSRVAERYLEVLNHTAECQRYDRRSSGVQWLIELCRAPRLQG
jgi:phosphatidyl-myo-inositol dimannoside synthase